LSSAAFLGLVAIPGVGQKVLQRAQQKRAEFALLSVGSGEKIQGKQSREELLGQVAGEKFRLAAKNFVPSRKYADDEPRATEEENLAADNPSCLITALKQHDRSAWSAAVDRHLSEVWGFVFHLVGGDRAVAEDLNQETWLEAIDGIGQCDAARGSFRNWLYGIARKGRVAWQEAIRRTCGGGFRIKNNMADMTFWADPQSARPVRIELDSPSFNARSVMSNFRYDMELDSALFSLEPPAGYDVRSMEAAMPVEEDLVNLLRLVAEHNDGIFPPTIGANKEYMQAVQADSKAKAEKLIKTPEAQKLMENRPVVHCLPEPLSAGEGPGT
jgi:DNA-directed RNA polymerase specialized sigma24 family protein